MNPEDSRPYHGKQSMMTPAEQMFFSALEAVTKERFKVFSQVRLSSIVDVDGSAAAYGARNKIDKKSVDFLLCDPVTTESRLVIELDDSSHERADRMARDEFVDEVLASAGIRILHVKTSGYYSSEALTKMIDDALAAPSREVSVEVGGGLRISPKIYRAAAVAGIVLDRVGFWRGLFGSKNLNFGRVLRSSARYQKIFTRRLSSAWWVMKVLALLIFIILVLVLVLLVKTIAAA